MPKNNAEPRWLPLLVLTVLLTACAISSPPSCPPPEPVPPPRIPALPVEARQPEAISICSPSCTDALTLDRENSRKRLMYPGPPGSPANGSTTR